ncbi:MAG: hypothetical protein PWP02_958 [Thermosipho sp. (in: thermotogales)]|nr:hypothetical protein [Petrotoga sp.]MDN5325243.1 hypothetical protein [Thermosipho sp. (in: thermotogales)]
MSHKKNIFVSKDDIKQVEKVLFLNGEKFGEEEKEIIKCFDRSIDIIAAPGSGKTTVLIAKLIILLNRMPFSDEGGICVLTHTNVAIDEIKNKLEDKSKRLFDYPNFIGTIQKFVDKFLTIPMYKHIFKKNLTIIDDLTYEETLYKHLRENEREFIELSTYLKRKSPHQKIINYLKKIDIKISNNNDIEFLIVKGKKKSYVVKNKDTSTYKQLKELLWERTIKEDGTMNYRLAYSFADAYIKKFPILKEYFSCRFKYVFIDEMQDTSNYQSDILNKVFDNNKTIIQKFGDPNQSIYNEKHEINSEDKGWNFIENQMYISSSKRFGDKIAFFVNKLNFNEIYKITGNKSINSYEPHIIVFKNNNICKVLDKFVDLIESYNLKKQGNIFKAIGWRKNAKNTNLSIKSYYPDFEKNNYNYKENNGVSNLYKIIVDSIFKILKGSFNTQIDNKKSMLIFLEENYNHFYNQLRKNCINWYMNKNTIRSLSDEIYDFINKELLEKIDGFEVNNFKRILNKNLNKLFIVKENKNKYVKNDIEVFIDTVHGVKGETHTATLYLETFYKNKTDMERILDFLYNNKKEDDIIKQTLNVFYVGISRPRVLLCIAVRESTIKDYKGKINNCKIIELP